MKVIVGGAFLVVAIGIVVYIAFRAAISDERAEMEAETRARVVEAKLEAELDYVAVAQSLNHRIRGRYAESIGDLLENPPFHIEIVGATKDWWVAKASESSVECWMTKGEAPDSLIPKRVREHSYYDKNWTPPMCFRWSGSGWMQLRWSGSVER